MKRYTFWQMATDIYSYSWGCVTLWFATRKAMRHRRLWPQLYKPQTFKGDGLGW